MTLLGASPPLQVLGNKPSISRRPHRPPLIARTGTPPAPHAPLTPGTPLRPAGLTPGHRPAVPRLAPALPGRRARRRDRPKVSERGPQSPRPALPARPGPARRGPSAAPAVGSPGERPGRPLPPQDQGRRPHHTCTGGGRSPSTQAPRGARRESGRSGRLRRRRPGPPRLRTTAPPVVAGGCELGWGLAGGRGVLNSQFWPGLLSETTALPPSQITPKGNKAIKKKAPFT